MGKSDIYHHPFMVKSVFLSGLHVDLIMQKSQSCQKKSCTGSLKASALHPQPGSHLSFLARGSLQLPWGLEMLMMGAIHLTWKTSRIEILEEGETPQCTVPSFSQSACGFFLRPLLAARLALFSSPTLPNQSFGGGGGVREKKREREA